MPKYRIVAPVVVVKTMGDHGMTWKHMQAGAFVPDDAGEEWVACHLRDGMIAPVPDGAPPAAAPLPPEPEPEPPAPEPETRSAPSRTKASAAKG